MQRIILIILIVLGQVSVLWAQQPGEPYLLLQKAGTQRKAVFLEGDEIRFQIRGDNYFRKDFILGLRRDTVRFHYYEIALRDFEVIDISKKRFQNFHFDSGGNKVIAAGILFLAGDYINQKLIQDEPGGVSAQTWAISGGIIGAGFLMKLFRKRKFRPGGRFIIDIVDFRPR